MKILPIISKPHNDELFMSWAYRLAEENGLSIGTFAQSYLWQRDIDVRKMSPDGRSEFFEFSQYMPPDVDIREMFYGTTTFGFEELLLPPHRQTKILNNYFRPRDGLNPSLRPFFDRICICPKCLKEDIKKYGHPYAHRSHQLGAKTCYKHGCGLLEFHGVSGHECEFNTDDYKPIDITLPLSDEQAYAEYTHELLIRETGRCNAYLLKNAVYNRCRKLGYTGRDRYQKLGEDISKWERRALLDGVDLDRFMKTKMAYANNLQERETIPVLMFLFPNAKELIKKCSDKEPVLRQYTCPECGQSYYQTEQAHEQGWGCPYCDSEIPEGARLEKLVHNTGNGHYEALDGFTSMGAKMRFRHKDCGGILTVTPSAFLFDGKRCQCERIVSEETARKKIERNPRFKLVKFVNTNTEITVRDTVCGNEFQADYMRFQKSPRCPICDPVFVSRKMFEQKVRDLVGDEYTVESFTNMQSKAAIRHKACGSVQAYDPQDFLDGQRCKGCSTLLRNGDLERMLNGYSNSRYHIVDSDSGYCTVEDSKTGERKRLTRRRIAQEIHRPTPSPVLPVDESEKGEPFDTTWDENFKLLSEYMKEHNGKSPVLREIYRGHKLGVWCGLQRRSYRWQNLSPARIEKLNSIGFEWAPKAGRTRSQSKEWNTKYNVLVEYKAEYGTTAVPIKAVYHGVTLGSWCSGQRRLYRQGKLSEEKIRLLNDIGFIWDTRPHKST